MVEKSTSYRIFTIINYILITVTALICFLPFLNVLAVSLSDRTANAAGMVTFWPVNLTLASYEYVISNSSFIKAIGISALRVLCGGTLNLLLTVFCAYPLSKDGKRFRSRIYYVWFFLIASLFNGGLVPTYMVVKETGLLNNFCSLIIPGAVPIGNVILMLNFFRNLPKEMEEAAIVDGASQLRILKSIYIPLSKASIATVTLFSVVAHWNSWLDGMIYFLKSDKYPLATYLHTIMIENSLNLMTNTSDMDTLNLLMSITDESAKAAQLFIGMIPILCVYPFLQKYFTKGIVVGSVKG